MMPPLPRQSAWRSGIAILRVRWPLAVALLAALTAAVVWAGTAAVLRADPPAPGKPAKPTRRTANCTEGPCHPEVRNYKVMHGPASLGACDVCHTYSDEKAHTFALKREKSALCTFCHVGKTEGKFVHKAVQDGQCLGCHNPHGGPDRSLLRAADMGKLCAGCHGDITKGRSHVHGPVAAGTCAACHNAHSSDLPKLLVAQGRNLCLGCHDTMGKQLKQVKFTHKPVIDGDCTQCHEVHASNQIMQLKQAPLDLCASCHAEIKKTAQTAAVKHSPVLGVPTSESAPETLPPPGGTDAVSRSLPGNPACLNCHTPHGGDFARLMKNEPVKVCLTCHDKQIKTDSRTVASMARLADPATFKHGPIREGNCAGCHTPHGGPVERLLTKPYPESFYQAFDLDKYALCFSCHDKQLALLPQTAGLTNFRNGQRNLHYLHVNKPNQGRSCRVCHETHVSDRPLHIRETVPYGQWQMPINFVQTKTGGGCSPGCHQPFSYDRQNPVVQPGVPTPTTAPDSTTKPAAADRPESSGSEQKTPAPTPAPGSATQPGPIPTRPLSEPPVWAVPATAPERKDKP